MKGKGVDARPKSSAGRNSAMAGSLEGLAPTDHKLPGIKAYSPKSHIDGGLALRCRLVASGACSRSQGLGWFAIKGARSWVRVVDSWSLSYAALEFEGAA